MKSLVRLRMTEFLVAVAAVIAVIVYTERSAWRQIHRLRQDLGPEALSQARSADRLRLALLDLDKAWRAALDATNSSDTASFERAGKAFEAQLNQELQSAATPRERTALENLRSGYRAYHEMALRSLSEPAVAAGDMNTGLVWHIGAQLSRMLTLSEELGAANQARADKLLKETEASLTRLQRFLFLSLAALLLCGAAVLILTYRRMVGPLQSRLAESRALMDRQEKLASLGVFATGIAHEIRNPITAIKVRLFTLKGSHRPGTSEHEDLEVIDSEISRLERIVQEFLRFARPAEPDLLTMPIDTFLQEVYDLLLPELKKRSLHFELELNANESVRIDPEKMKQVLLNFIHNAADSIEGEGTVTLRSRRDGQIVDGRALPAVVIEISDTGKGMPPEVQNRLFDPFFTTKEKGTGLGLPIAARIVEKHGGLIQYRTEVDKGTTFSILLPRAKP